MRKGRSYELSRCVRCTRESNTTGRRGEGTPKALQDLVLFRRKTAAAKPWPRPRPGWGGGAPRAASWWERGRTCYRKPESSRSPRCASEGSARLGGSAAGQGTVTVRELPLWETNRFPPFPTGRERDCFPPNNTLKTRQDAEMAAVLGRRLSLP